MTTSHSLSHTKWDCKYHIVWIPKYRKKRLFWELRQELGPVLRELATHKARYWKGDCVQTMCTY
jgi:putative transposase